MPLDRQSIERRDFPIARRGYEPEAVDEHLQSLADEIESLRRGRGRGDSLAAAASEQVRLIVEAAETSATEIEREAEYQASQIRADAREDADRLTAEAEAKAKERVAAVSAATDSLLERISAMESEVGSLFESLRTGANRLSADLALLQGGIGDLRTAADASFDPGDEDFAASAPASVATPRRSVEPSYAPQTPEPVAPAYSEPRPATPAYAGDIGSDSVVDAIAAEPEPVASEPEPEPVIEAQPSPVVEAEPAAAEAPRRRSRRQRQQAAAEPAADESGAAEAAPASSSADEEGARLIALNMALNGTPREETERYLVENFALTNPDALLDDVYARAGG